MWGILIVFLLVIGAMTWWDGKRVYENESKKDLWVYLGLMGVVVLFGTVSIMGVRIPAPLDPIEKVLSPLGKVLIGE